MVQCNFQDNKQRWPNPEVWPMPTFTSCVLLPQACLLRHQRMLREIPNYKRQWHKAMKKIALLIVSQNVPTCCLNSSWSFDSSIWHEVGWNEFVPAFDSKLFWWVLTLKCLRLDRCHSMVPDFLKGKAIFGKAGGSWWRSYEPVPTSLVCQVVLCAFPVSEVVPETCCLQTRDLFWQLPDTAKSTYRAPVQWKWKWAWEEPHDSGSGQKKSELFNSST